MSLLYRLVFATKCSSTHHKLALDALCQLGEPNGPRWRDLFLKHHVAYLTGAKAPDATFKDFKNHVLHVGESFWGGAAESCRHWYAQSVESLRQEQWSDAVYSAGVMSHYYADPIHPFHTGQTEEEGKVHRALEWSVAKSYEALQEILQSDPDLVPSVEVPESDDWLEQMVCQGATLSHADYEVLLDHYNFEAGIKRPEAGLDDELRRRIARLVGYAVSGLARILERAFTEANVQPPAVSLLLESFLASLQVPVAIVAKKLSDARERALLADIAAEVAIRGKPVLTLPEDDWTVRRLHAKEVLKVPVEQLDVAPVKRTGLKFGREESPTSTAVPRLRPASRPMKSPEQARSPVVAPAVSQAATDRSPPRPPAVSQPTSAVPFRPQRRGKFHLEPASPVVDAPSIGGKTADRLVAAGIITVADLLAADPAETAARVGQAWITAEVIRRWKAESALVCRVPELRGHDAQFLVASGLEQPAQIADQNPVALLDRVEEVLATKEGQRILRSGEPPDLEEVTAWIAQAKQARELPSR